MQLVSHPFGVQKICFLIKIESKRQFPAPLCHLGKVNSGDSVWPIDYKVKWILAFVQAKTRHETPGNVHHSSPLKNTSKQSWLGISVKMDPVYFVNPLQFNASFTKPFNGLICLQKVNSVDDIFTFLDYKGLNWWVHLFKQQQQQQNKQNGIL